MFGGTALATTFVCPTQLTATGTSTTRTKGTVKITVENPDPGKVDSSRFVERASGRSRPGESARDSSHRSNCMPGDTL